MEGLQSGCLEAESRIGSVVLGDLTHQALERQLADQELTRPLVSSDLLQRPGPGSVSERCPTRPSARVSYVFVIRVLRTHEVVGP